MNDEHARVILQSALFAPGDVCTETALSSLGWYLCARAGEGSAVLDGQFTIEELEAIVMWMRNPALCAPMCVEG